MTTETKTPQAAAESPFYSVKPLVTALQRRPVKSVLLVGNSLMFYNCGVAPMLNGFAKAKGVKLETTMVGIGGAGLCWHDVKSYLRPNGLRSYRINESNTFEFIDYPDGRIFDAVIMVDSTQGPIYPELKKLFQTYAARHCADGRATGAEPLLMVSWGYKDRPGMTKALADSIITTANDNRCMAVPCGIAFENAAAVRPDLALIRSDNRHPTVAGTYLEAAVFYAVLMHESPEGAAFTGRYDDLQLSEKDAAFLQQIAWLTVKSFNGWTD